MEKKTSWVIQDDGLIHETVEGQHKENWKEMYRKEYKLRQELKKELQEVREDNKKLTCQIEDYINQLRKVALL
tara:strand:+ start:347 stop:565 length:219 start_codon:yes stop_codon:yes gene_type:complete